MSSARVVVMLTIAGALVMVWLAVSLARAGRRWRTVSLGAQARDALVRFADRALEIESVSEILGHARDTAWRLFGSQRVVAFEPGADRGTWDAGVPGQPDLPPLPPVPVSMRGPFGWFVHNNRVAARAELGDRRFGAIRAPLRDLMDRYEVDLLVPLVEHGRLLALVGILLGRRPTALDREVLSLFRLEVTAACANVKLHREAAQVLTLAREIDLASAVKLALVPDENEGQHESLSWSGHFEAAGQAGSDFWSVYPLADGKALFLIGDAVGSGLSGTMVSAVVKGCCDAVYDGKGDEPPGPSELLTLLNAAIYRSASPANARCFAALLDPARGRIVYANAGHSVPYRLVFGEGEVGLGVLAGSGPLLGDSPDPTYRENRSQLSADEGFLLYTDGLVKTRDRSGEPFGERRLQRVLAGQTGASARDLRETVLTALAAYRDGGALTDDIALVAVRSTGES